MKKLIFLITPFLTILFAGSAMAFRCLESSSGEERECIEITESPYPYYVPNSCTRKRTPSNRYSVLKWKAELTITYWRDRKKCDADQNCSWVKDQKSILTQREVQIREEEYSLAYSRRVNCENRRRQLAAAANKAKVYETKPYSIDDSGDIDFSSFEDEESF